jgi:NAD(P)-dependent dehydrogenase (short-subunit alcohol dehydrogenase family)
MDLGLTDKTALVTGGSKGIGRAVALSLAAEGARVMICARDPDTLERTAGEIEGTTGRVALTVPGDLSLPAEVSRVAAEAVAQLGRLDILVNNAGACDAAAPGPAPPALPLPVRRASADTAARRNLVKQRTFRRNYCLDTRQGRR